MHSQGGARHLPRQSKNIPQQQTTYNQNIQNEFCRFRLIRYFAPKGRRCQSLLMSGSCFGIHSKGGSSQTANDNKYYLHYIYWNENASYLISINKTKKPEKTVSHLSWLMCKYLNYFLDTNTLFAIVIAVPYVPPA